jgi:hypothetical protein
MDIGYDYLTHLNYIEYPLTPYPDNFIVLENNDRIASPPMNLIIGDVIIWHPDYGDINVNTYPWEIGDAVTFLNYFMGLTSFTRRQYANSDCNRDGVQATISDLVFLLRTISGNIAGPSDILPTGASGPTWNPDGETPRLASSSSGTAGQMRRLAIDSEIPLGGASFEFDLGQEPLTIDEIRLGPAADSARLLCSLQGNKLRVSVVNFGGHGGAFACGDLFYMIFDNSESEITENLRLISAEFSNDFGQAVIARYSLDGTESEEIQSGSGVKLGLSGYPNPFNGTTRISLVVPADGNYQLAAYDVLGRQITQLWNGRLSAGNTEIFWDATDSDQNPVASGTYFLRLHGDDGSCSMRLYLLK